MNGIDVGTAALLANRLTSLDPVGSQGSAGAAGTGVSSRVSSSDTLPADALTGTAPQASTETVLSAVALALDAIIRSGGEATPAVVGNAPVWTAPETVPQSDAAPQSGAPSLPPPGVISDVAAQAAVIEATLLADEAAGLIQTQAQTAADLNGSGAPDNASTAATAAAQGEAAAASAGTAAQAAVAAQSGPVAALAAALSQTVAGSGLFYESHLAQWLVGQHTLADLAGEPQNRLVEQGAQLPNDWALASGEADDVLWADTSAAGSRELQAGNLGPNAANSPLTHLEDAQTLAGTLAPNAALVRASGALGEAALLPAQQDTAAPGATVHPAVIPLVRQQLDLLATGEFRWTGEAWSGVRLDWSIQQDQVDPRDSRRGMPADPADKPWRTRLTLALPSLGTVDAELTLAGSTLAVRVQANESGAARLASGSPALRSRLEALGLALTGLSIREVGAGAASPADAAKAAHAYARAAAAQETPTRPAEASAGANAGASAAAAFDWEL